MTTQLTVVRTLGHLDSLIRIHDITLRGGQVAVAVRIDVLHRWWQRSCFLRRLLRLLCLRRLCCLWRLRGLWRLRSLLRLRRLGVLRAEQRNGDRRSKNQAASYYFSHVHVLG